MSGGFLRIRFVDDYDGSGELIAHAGSNRFSGIGRAYFNTDTIAAFATAIAAFPLSNDARPMITGGFSTTDRPDELDQEHLGITAYPIGSRGYIGVRVRMATPLHAGERPESRESATIEVVTTYEPLARFSRDLISMLRGNAEEAVLFEDR